ncbi:MAG TPA: metalloregulator ArsR/SmtB family transcription factor [Candidatus Paceibacterota bacterium]|nr:metalloregulator ArsR/SmtB family transcription factor [Candidatus Paceibacterota bacterium]
MREEIKERKIEALAKKLLVAGDLTRLKILCLIFDDKKACVSEIAKKLDMSVAIVSHHLQCLARAGLLEPNREGKLVCYSLVKSRFNADLKNFICRNKQEKI